MSYWQDFRDESEVQDFKIPKKKKKKKHTVAPKKKKHTIRPSFKVDGYVEFDGTPHFGERTLTNIHLESACSGRHCVIHDPSDHHMRDLPIIWNAQETQMERLCAHDVTHPDPDDLAYWVSVGSDWKAHHDCCPERCCKSK